jgi:phospholipid N-methyltransferase
MDKLLKHAQFLHTAVRDPKVGAIAMSSSYLITKVAKLLPKELSSVVELGPGSGAMTRALLRRLSSDGILVTIEANPVFANSIRKLDDARIQVVEGMAQDSFADAIAFLKTSPELIVASIPFTLISPRERMRLLERIYDSLAPGGVFIIFHQYSFMMFGAMKRVFRSAELSFEILNIPPCFIMRAEKPATAARTQER